MTTETQIEEGRQKTYRILLPLYRRLAFVTLLLYGLLIALAPMDNWFDYFRAAAMVAGFLNIVMVIVVVVAYNARQDKKSLRALPRHIQHVGTGYILLVLAAATIMMDHWGEELTLLGTPIAMAGFIFGLYGLHILMTFQYAKNLRKHAIERELRDAEEK